jgi:hypothetical protein
VSCYAKNSLSSALRFCHYTLTATRWRFFLLLSILNKEICVHDVGLSFSVSVCVSVRSNNFWTNWFYIVSKSYHLFSPNTHHQREYQHGGRSNTWGDDYACLTYKSPLVQLLYELQHMKTLHSAHRMYLCVSYGSFNKQRFFLPKYHQPVDLCNGVVTCFAWGTNWIFIYYMQ